ncbi:MFS transporter [Alphaproteobacteria bacterium]|nr:MFS transporter [Alphaproteobacteria bacterium]
MPEAESKPLTSALQIPAYRAYFICGWFSTVGFWVFKMALGWAAWEKTQSPFWTGVIVASTLAPTFLLTPVFGVFADRWRIKRSMMTITFGGGLVSLAFAIGAYSELLNVSYMIFFGLLHGVLVAAYSPMRLSVMPRLVPKSLYLSAAGLGAFVFNFSRIVGPVVGGIVIAKYGVVLAFFISSISSFLYVLFFMRVTLTPKEGKPLERRSLVRELIDGVIYLRQLPGAMMIVLLTGLNGLLGRSFFEILPAYNGAVLESGAEGLATLTAASGAGAACLGIYLQISRSGKQGSMLSMVIVLALSCLALQALGLTSQMLVAALLSAAMGFLATYIGVLVQTQLQVTTDDNHRGRVMSIWTTVSLGVPAIGAFMLGGLGSLFGVSGSLLISGTLGLVVLVIVLVANKRTA